MDPERIGKGIQEIVEEADEYLSERDSVRESAIRKTREIIRNSGRSISSLLKGSVSDARNYLAQAERLVEELLRELSPYPELYYSGMVNNALSEYVEARLFNDLVLNGRVPGYRELGVPPVPYLQGMADLVGELRRLILELVRGNEYDKAWKYAEVMENIYLVLARLDYPDALLPGLRHKLDVARRLVDDTKMFLVDMESRDKLSRLLKTR
ncbi:MAG: haloacid dehalogenase [Desulfurococcales archaeon]|nr:haloacid dehalogenase [Desulfurococcales archaeon]